MKDRVKFKGHFNFKLWDQTHTILKWEVDEDNLVVNVGLQHILDILFISGTSQIDPWYVGLLDDTPVPAAGDTMGAHGGWTEFEDYSEATRQTYVDVRAAQTVSNTAAKATFTVNQDSSIIAGAFMTSDNVKGAGDGTLLCAVAFSGGDKGADENDILEVTYTFIAVDDGV